MLVIVTERTKEIGLRKALGATKLDILAQFIIESVLLCLVGGFLGVAAGYAATGLLENVLQNYFSVQLTVPGWAVLISLVFTTGVGIFFGFYPALKAARKDPVEALRYE
jgi:putative ABC transport system permease protein